MENKEIFKVGQELKAINPCDYSLTIGKKYVITSIDDRCIYITNNEKRHHGFTFENLHKYFEPLEAITLDEAIARAKPNMDKIKSVDDAVMEAKGVEEKLSFDFLQNKILDCNASSEYKQASIIIIRNIFEKLNFKLSTK